MVWRIASLREIEEHWSINDLADANEALDARLRIETPQDR